MTGIRRLTVLLAIYTGMAGAQTAISENEILAAHRAWFDAFDRGDVDAIAAMETDDFVLINVDRIVEKATQLVNIRTGFGGGVDQTRVAGVHSFSSYGDTAVITGIEYSSTQAGGNSILFSEVWVLEDGGWKIRLAHFSPAGRDP